MLSNLLKYDYLKLTLILERQVLSSRFVYENDKGKKKKHGVLLCDSVPYCHYPMEGDFLFLSFFFFLFTWMSNPSIYM